MTGTLTDLFEVRPASPLIGAEIEGVDLTQPVEEATAQALRALGGTLDQRGGGEWRVRGVGVGGLAEPAAALSATACSIASRSTAT